MALNDVTFVKGQGGLGRPLDGEDHISGIVYYCADADLPEGFGSGSDADRIKVAFSLDDAEALGIKGDYSGDVPPDHATITVTGSSITTGNTLEVFVNSVSIGIATAASTHTPTAVALLLSQAINNGTGTHGFTTTVSGAVVTLIAPPLSGNRVNGGVTTTATGGDLGATIVNFANGKPDPMIILWYHISEYFRVQPKGVLYIGLFSSTDPDYTKISAVQTVAADGKIRQIAVYTTEDFDIELAQISTLHNTANTLSATNKKPLSVLFAPNLYKVTDGMDFLELSTLPDLSESVTVGSYVSVIIGQDGNNFGKELFNYRLKSISCLGATLGAVSRSKVSENIGWVKNYNMADTELDVLAFAEGTAYREVSENLLSTLNDNHYIFLKKHIGINGSYFNDSHTAVSEASDYATIENNRTIDKAIRSIRTFLIPELNGPLFVDPVAGTLSEDTSAYFQNLASRPLEQMQRDQELSGFQVIVNPAQDVLSTSKLVIVVKLVPVGVARQIQVNIGFTVKLS